ncbi:hypothetical protein PN499_19410 [Kamptonema animale CS-326]|uniref:hypothetical protein n=1 Tax=Kamptonema animale TaxID=92934 RepID=UPI00232DA445|nr:hypothetical protein [Kamptonema animale]MDB9513366.1 hypothetical protein [Kamptonema animale CS-326]
MVLFTAYCGFSTPNSSIFQHGLMLRSHDLCLPSYQLLPPAIAIMPRFKTRWM